MIREVAATAAISLRTALRSRLAPMMALVLLAVAIWLPMTIRGDGTPEGLIRVHLTYTLGISSFLLGLFSLWAGSAGVSREAESKTLQLLVVKPVPRSAIWLGKWAGLLVLDAVFLGLAVGASGWVLAVRLRRGEFTEMQRTEASARALASLETVRAPLPDLEAEVRAEYGRLRAAGRLPEAPESTVLAQIRRHRLIRHYAVAPGASHEWTFALPKGAEADTPFFVQMQCDSSQMGSAETRVELQMGGTMQEVEFIPGVARQVPGDFSFAAAGAGAEGAPTLTVRVRNRDPQQATLFFDPTDGVVLRMRAGSFAGNLFRAALQLYFRLALLAALGLTLGTLFSMPVATFLSLALLILLQLSGFVGAAAQTDRAVFVANVAPFRAGAEAHAHETAAGAEGAAVAEEEEPSAWAEAAATLLYYVYRGTWVVLRPLLENQTLDLVTTATVIPIRDVVRHGLQQGLLLPLLLGGISTAALRRREWALPAES